MCEHQNERRCFACVGRAWPVTFRYRIHGRFRDGTRLDDELVGPVIHVGGKEGTSGMFITADILN